MNLWDSEEGGIGTVLLYTLVFLIACGLLAGIFIGSCTNS